MKITPTALPEVLLIERPVFRDHRGYLTVSYEEAAFAEMGLPPFIQDNHSHSIGPVLRGLHFQLEHPQAKLVRCLTGKIWDVAVDLRVGSPHFMTWVGVELSEGDGRQLYIPAGFGHGFFVLSDKADVFYKVSDMYHAPSNRAVRWDDPALKIKWPVTTAPILSSTDAAAPFLKEIPQDRLPVYQK